MWRTTFAWAALAGALAAAPSIILAEDPDPPRHTYVIDLSLRRGESPAEQVRGPVRLKLTNLDRVRYKAIVGQQVTVLDPTDISAGGFASPLAAPAASAAAAAAESARETAGEAVAAAAGGVPPTCPPTTAGFSARLDDIRACLRVEEHAVAALLDSAEKAADLLAKQQKSVQRLLGESGQVLLADEGAALLAGQVRTELAAIAAARAEAMRLWPGPDLVARHDQAIADLDAALADLPRTPDNTPWRDWYGATDNYLLYARTREAIDDLATSLGKLDPDGDFVEGVEEVDGALAAWQRDLAGLDDPDAYAMTIDVRCGYPFFQEKRVDYNLTLIDRTVSDPAKNKSVEKLVTVVCPSNLKVSAGVGVADIAERDFGFVSSVENGMLVNEIGLLNESDQQINPVALISTRLLGLDAGGAFGLHATTGVVADYDNPEGGLRIGYLLGVSFSFRDSLLLTLAYQGMRVPALAGDFELGDPQVQGLDAVPVTKDWEFGWSIGLSYGLGGGS
jgi:hypothetical protein